MKIEKELPSYKDDKSWSLWNIRKKFTQKVLVGDVVAIGDMRGVILEILDSQLLRNEVLLTVVVQKKKVDLEGIPLYSTNDLRIPMKDYSNPVKIGSIIDGSNIPFKVVHINSVKADTFNITFNVDIEQVKTFDDYNKRITMMRMIKNV